MAEATTLFVTASMTRLAPEVRAAELERQHRLAGYSHIAVHYVIERDGNVAEGRNPRLPGCLAGRLNSEALQVCLIGGVDDDATPTDNFTPQQREALRALSEHLGLPVVFDRYCPTQEL